MHAVAKRIPPRFHKGWKEICDEKASWPSADAEAAADWIALHGMEFGARPMTLQERSREMGIDTYAPLLGLAPPALWAAQGNAFHPEALRLLMVTPLSSALRSPPPIGGRWRMAVWCGPRGRSIWRPGGSRTRR